MQKAISSLGQRLCTNCGKLSLSHKVNAKLPLATVVTPGRTMSGESKGQMASRLKGTEKNIWVEFGKLAAEYKCLNLGQGFPDFKPPDHVVKYMVDALNSDNALLSQYARSYGHPRLVNILSKLYAPFLKHEVNPMTDITVGIGAYGVLFSAVQGHVNPGDEVIIVEPYFDCYEPMAKVAGATPRYIPLRPTKEGGTSADWKIDPAELESLFNSKTKALIINNPNNPVGKVFSAEELQMVGDLCRKYNTICISDEVYEWLVFDGLKHVKMASLPGMWDHTITIGSGGKTFSATGWKIGWAIGPQKLIQPMQILHQNCVYTCPTPIQEAMAVGLEHELSLLDRPEECYLFSLAKETQEKRDYLVKMLTEMGWVCTVPEGGYFLMADGSKLNIDVPDDGLGDPKDFQFVRWMCREKKLAAIPPSAFYNPEHKSMGEKYVRFCFIKKQETLDKAAELFKEWKKAL